MTAADFTPQRIHWLRAIWHRPDLVATLDAIEELQAKLATTDKWLIAAGEAIEALKAENAAMRDRLRWRDPQVEPPPEGEIVLCCVRLDSRPPSTADCFVGCADDEPDGWLPLPEVAP